MLELAFEATVSVLVSKALLSVPLGFGARSARCSDSLGAETGRRTDL